MLCMLCTRLWKSDIGDDILFDDTPNYSYVIIVDGSWQLYNLE